VEIKNIFRKIVSVAKQAAVPTVTGVSHLRENPRFTRKLDLSDEALTDGDFDYRYECLTFIYKRRDTAFKYSLCFTLAVLIYMIVFGIIGVNSAMGGLKNPLGELTGMQAALPVVIVPAVFAGFMKSPAVIIAAILYIVIGAYFLIAMQFLIVIPFCIIGAVLYFRLLGVVNAYDTLSHLPGFPDFTPLS
jgi:hypothetical protein